MVYVHLLSNSAKKKKQGRLCASGSRNEGGWTRLPSEPLSISRYWTRDDTRERTVTNYCVPRNFALILCFPTVSRSIPHLKISQCTAWDNISFGVSPARLFKPLSHVISHKLAAVFYARPETLCAFFNAINTRYRNETMVITCRLEI